MGRLGSRRRWVSVSLVMLAASLAFAMRDDFGQVLRDYKTAETAGARATAIARFADCEDGRVLSTLTVIAREDVDVGVRIAALRLIARRDEPRVGDVIFQFVVDGGVQRFRRESAKILAQRPGALDRLRDGFGSARSSQPIRLRLVEALASFPSLDAYAELDALSRSSAPNVRAAALHAIASHALGRSEIAETLVAALRSHDDLTTVLTALDLAEDHAMDRFGEIEPLE